MAETPGVRVRVFGWSETWRVVPERDGERWRFRIVLDARSTGRAAPPFLERTEWTADELRPKAIDAYLPHLSCPVMGLFGEADRLVPLAEIERFREYLEKHKKSYHIRLLADTPHGWLNDTMTDDRYRPEAAREAWALMVSFLNDVFSGKWDPSRVIWRFESDTSPDYGLATE